MDEPVSMGEPSFLPKCLTGVQLFFFSLKITFQLQFTYPILLASGGWKLIHSDWTRRSDHPGKSRAHRLRA